MGNRIPKSWRLQKKSHVCEIQSLWRRTFAGFAKEWREIHKSFNFSSVYSVKGLNEKREREEQRSWSEFSSQSENEMECGMWMCGACFFGAKISCCGFHSNTSSSSLPLIWTTTWSSFRLFSHHSFASCTHIPTFVFLATRFPTRELGLQGIECVRSRSSKWCGWWWVWGKRGVGWWWDSHSESVKKEESIIKADSLCSHNRWGCIKNPFSFSLPPPEPAKHKKRFSGQRFWFDVWLLRSEKRVIKNA